METLYFNNKKTIMAEYYEGIAFSDWLEQTPIHWVIYGPYEKEISSSFAADLILKVVYENDSVIIYKVEQ